MTRAGFLWCGYWVIRHSGGRAVRLIARAAGIMVATSTGMVATAASTFATAEVPAVASVAPPSPAACTTLPAGTYSDGSGDAVTIVQSALVAPANGIPQYCDAIGRIAGRISFEIRMPDSTWNGQYVQVGNGGFCGSISTASGGGNQYLQRGAAIAGDDSGHVGTPFDATFGGPPGGANVQARIDWAYYAEHALSGAAKNLINAYYGVPAQRAYFIGCSTGGRQALMEAQRYPTDFDGIVAGDPANLQNYLAPISQGYREVANRDRTTHAQILEPNRVSIIQNAVEAACDPLHQGFVDDPRLCAFDVRTVHCAAGASDTSNCMTDAEFAVVQKWYDSPRASDGTELFPGGEPLGSEGGWNLSALGTDASLSFGGMFGDQDLKYLAYPMNPPPGYNGIYDFDFDHGKPGLAPMASVYNSDNPDMSAFRNRGGKVILYHGFSDPLITPFQTIQYYEDSVTAMGGLTATQAWFRLFLLPGVYHCSGGNGPSNVDWYGAIDRWVAGTQAPDRLVASGTNLTRPLYPYPLEARYSGSGPTTDANSFTAFVGPRGRGLMIAGITPATAPASGGATTGTATTPAATAAQPLPFTVGPEREVSTAWLVGALGVMIIVGCAVAVGGRALRA